MRIEISSMTKAMAMVSAMKARTRPHARRRGRVQGEEEEEVMAWSCDWEQQQRRHHQEVQEAAVLHLLAERATAG